MTDKNPWPMLGYHAYPIDLDTVAWDVASMCAGNPLPYEWDRNRLEDGNGNEVFVQDCLAAINATPALLLEIRALRAKINTAKAALEIIDCDDAPPWAEQAAKIALVALAAPKETK